jgi:tubulin alpha
MLSFDTSELTDCAFKPAHTLHSLNREQGKYVACYSIYRGSVPVDDINTATAEHQPSDRAGKKTKPWVEGVPGGFKSATARKSAVPFEDEPINVGDRSLCMLTNHTGLASTFALMGKKFDTTYSTRAFVWWYVGEGMEEGKFHESRECIDKLVSEYQAL